MPNSKQIIQILKKNSSKKVVPFHLVPNWTWIMCKYRSYYNSREVFTKKTEQNTIGEIITSFAALRI